MAPRSTPRRSRGCRHRTTASAVTAAGWLACVTSSAVRFGPVVRTLRGVTVHAVWCELQKRGGGWMKPRLLLSTDPALSGVAIVEAYANRWTVEPLFAALKLTDGMGAMWQRSRTVLLRWLHLVQIGRALLVLLTAKAEPETLALVRVGGWRKAATLTPGLVKDALTRRFRDFEAFRLVPTTRAKSGPVRGTGPPEPTAAA